MYKIYAGNTLIFDDIFANEYRIINSVLTLEDNAAGSLEFLMLPDCPVYSTIQRMKTIVSVHKGSEEIWAGRVVEESTAFNLSKRITCEGELAFLNDTIQPPASYQNGEVHNILSSILSTHSNKVAAGKRFMMGECDVTQRFTCITDYDVSLDCIKDKFIDRFGGHLQIRKENGNRYLDYIKDLRNTNSQVIRFGLNLVDFTKSFDMTNFATVIVPLGAPIGTSTITGTTQYTDVSSVNGGSIYVYNQNTVSEFGWVDKVVHFDDIDDPQTLLSKAQTYLSETQFDEMRLEVSAMDLNYLNPNSQNAPEYIKLHDKVRVVSDPHGLDRYFPVSKLTIPLDNPEKAVFELGDTVKMSLTKKL